MDFLAIFDNSDKEWSNLFEKNEKSDNVQIPQWILDIKDDSKRELLSNTYLMCSMKCELHNAEVIVMMKKIIIKPNEMSYKQREIYETLLQDPHLERDIIWMKSQNLNDLIGAPSNQRVSGRVIDSLMTKYPRFSDVHYYIDVTDLNNTIYVPRDCYNDYCKRNPNRILRLFNISSEYRSYMNLYSKTFFDPFSRGVEVLHEMSDGKFVTFSMCKLMFYRWSKKYHIFDFLKSNYVKISQIQREDQQRQRQYRVDKRKSNKLYSQHKPKRRYRCVTAALCPKDITMPNLSKKLFRIKVDKGKKENVNGKILTDIRKMFL